MRTLSLMTMIYVGMMLLLICAAPAGAQRPNLEGPWESETEGTVQIHHESDEVWIESSEPCPNGGQRPFILVGQLTGNILHGKMWRCTEQDLVTNCGHPKIYTIEFTAQVLDNRFLRDQIQIMVLQVRCNYEMEIWNKDDCKRDHNEPRLDFFAGNSSAPAPTSTPQPTPRDPCAWARCSYEYIQCRAWNLGLAAWPTHPCP